jgi:glyoxylase-like metal-dependent hydrolase (beta-lactamase superfamily II)
MPLATDAIQLAPGVRRLIAPNPSVMTGPGTNTYLLGSGEVAVLDPGPAIPEHVERIVAEAPGSVRWILVTHTHPDHSPGAAPLAARTGAELLGLPAPPGDHQDASFAPDRELADGDTLEFGEVTVDVVHTPGHASNHLCFRHAALDWLFTGDHVIDGSTAVIDPPDGDMGDYLASLAKIRALACRAIAPGHGNLIEDSRRAIDRLVRHRYEREAAVAAAMTEHPGLTTHELVPHVYRDVDPTLHGWAERSLLAHALKLEADGVARSDRGRWIIRS